MLIAATGFAGAGKTTALKLLEAFGIGEYFYVGGIVRAQMAARGLPDTPESEKAVRDALRNEYGMSALAMIASTDMRIKLEAGRTVLIDAICNTEESNYYREEFGDNLKLVAIITPFLQRASRLAARTDRTMTAEQLQERDNYEIEKLGMEEVAKSAHLTLDNSRTISDLESTLRGLANQISH